MDVFGKEMKVASQAINLVPRFSNAVSFSGIPNKRDILAEVFQCPVEFHGLLGRLSTERRVIVLMDALDRFEPGRSGSRT